MVMGGRIMKKLILFAFASFISFAACQKASHVGTTESADLAKGIEKIVFDRSGYVYHGRVKAVAEAAREAGLKF